MHIVAVNHYQLIHQFGNDDVSINFEIKYLD